MRFRGKSVFALCALGALTLAGAEKIPIKLMLPAPEAVVPVLTPGQRAFFASSDDVRRRSFGDAVMRAEWVALGWHPEPVTFVWDGFKSRKAKIRFRIWREEDDVCVCDTNFVFLTTGRFTWDNFRVGISYRWGLDVEGLGSARSRFRTEDIPPRLVRVPGVPNLRDLGGWRTADGRRVRQGLLYRSANLCENAAECTERPPRSRLTEETRRYLTETLGVRTELDLRNPKECEGLVVSPLGAGAKRVVISSGCYGAMKSDLSKEACCRALRTIASEENLPVLFHCSGGRDRTGTLAFLINGLLGVPPEDLARDWDATALWDNEHGWFNRNNSYAALLAVIDACPGATLNERIEAYVLSTGFTADEIARFRSVFLSK